MSYKRFDLDDVGKLTIYKRRGSRTMRLTVVSDGSVRMTIPPYVPFQAGLAFAEARKSWILEQPISRKRPLANQQEIGKHHRLSLVMSFSASKPSSRLAGDEIRVLYPNTMSPETPAVQEVITRACVRALRDEAESTIPSRLADLAERKDFAYKSVTIKQLRGRWGSCDQDKNIVINLFLMQLPWQLIDYVLLHELIHTKHLHHGQDFWSSFLAHEPKAKELRKQIKQYQPNFMN